MDGSQKQPVQSPDAAARPAWQRAAQAVARSLPAKLLALTLLFVMLAEVLIFVPSVANFRVGWLMDRLTAAHLASIAAEAFPGGSVPDALRMELLRSAQVKAVAIKRDEQRRLVLPPDMEGGEIAATFDLRNSSRPGGLWSEIANRAGLIGDALAVFGAPPDRLIRVIGEANMVPGSFVEIVLPEAKLRDAMVRFGLNVLGLSVVISMITAALVYRALDALLVTPMMRITHNMLRFSEKPEDVSRIIVPSSRTDEIGIAERELAHMQGELSQLLAQKSRLAALGLAVSKINHDLRNMLATAQLLSDRLTSVPDPRVQQFAPKLIASLDRAIDFCNATLKFGRAAEAAPNRSPLLLRPLLVEVGDGLGLPRKGRVDWILDIDPDLRIDADHDQLYRVLSNIARNAAQAIEAQGEGARGAIRIRAERRNGRVAIDCIDDGPGVPAKARAHLFQAFQGSTRRGGSGLGLAIAHELVAAHGGTLVLADSARGTTFRIEIPDRVV